MLTESSPGDRRPRAPDAGPAGGAARGERAGREAGRVPSLGGGGAICEAGHAWRTAGPPALCAERGRSPTEWGRRQPRAPSPSPSLAVCLLSRTAVRVRVRF